MLLSALYCKAESVFELGLGESTYIAAHVGIPRYAGIDSDALWISQAGDRTPTHFCFYLSDIGATNLWGKSSGPRVAKVGLGLSDCPFDRGTSCLCGVYGGWKNARWMHAEQFPACIC